MTPVQPHIVLIAAGCFVLAGAARVGTLLLDNGDRITGHIQRYDSGR